MDLVVQFMQCSLSLRKESHALGKLKPTEKLHGESQVISCPVLTRDPSAPDPAAGDARVTSLS